MSGQANAEYFVVLFTDENAVEVVSYKWVSSESTCYWPAAPGSKIPKLIQEHVIPTKSTATTSTEYRCRILSRSGNYLTARRLAKIAEDSSNLDSSPPETPIYSNHRRRHPRNNASSKIPPIIRKPSSSRKTLASVQRDDPALDTSYSHSEWETGTNYTSRFLTPQTPFTATLGIVKVPSDSTETGFVLTPPNADETLYELHPYSEPCTTSSQPTSLKISRHFFKN